MPAKCIPRLYRDYKSKLHASLERREIYAAGLNATARIDIFDTSGVQSSCVTLPIYAKFMLNYIWKKYWTRARGRERARERDAICLASVRRFGNAESNYAWDSLWAHERASVFGKGIVAVFIVQRGHCCIPCPCALFASRRWLFCRSNGAKLNYRGRGKTVSWILWNRYITANCYSVNQPNWISRRETVKTVLEKVFQNCPDVKLKWINSRINVLRHKTRPIWCERVNLFLYLCEFPRCFYVKIRFCQKFDSRGNWSEKISNNLIIYYIPNIRAELALTVIK